MEVRMRRFVIVVDAQMDFIARDGALAVAGADGLATPMNAWLAALQPEEVEGILFTFDTHEPEAYAGSAEGGQFPLHCVRGEPGWQLVIDPDVVDPAIPLYRLEKHVFAMWEEPSLKVETLRGPPSPPQPRDSFFESLKARGVDEVTVIGVAADYCVRWAIDGLVARGFRVEVPAALTRGIVQQIEAVVAESWPAGAVALG
jgi:nicotinamidase/pyrazinamidase